MQNLDPAVRAGILPVYELTRSRKTPKNLDSSILRRIEQIKTIQGTSPFILDLTTEFSLQTPEIIQMLENPRHGFKAWCDFLEYLITDEGLCIIPIIHYNPFAKAEVKQEILRLKQFSPVLAFRIGIGEEDLVKYIEDILSSMSFSDLILLLDAGYLELQGEDSGDNSASFEPILRQLKRLGTPKAISCMFSSFPSTVRKKYYGGDATGDFPVSEMNTFDILSKSFNVTCGDYASTHPFRYETRGGQWIPRIDAVYEDRSGAHRFFYMRVRREDGGYVTAAKKIFADSRYQKVSASPVTWGDREIAAAASEVPTGRAPSHWISVRINNYISLQYFRLKKAQSVVL